MEPDARVGKCVFHGWTFMVLTTKDVDYAVNKMKKKLI